MTKVRSFFGACALLTVLGLSFSPTADAQTDANSQTNTTQGGYDDNKDTNMNWLGLLGLIGLMGLKGKKARHEEYSGRTAHAQ